MRLREVYVFLALTAVVSCWAQQEDTRPNGDGRSRRVAGGFSSPAVGYFPRRLADESKSLKLAVAPLYGSVFEYAYYFLNVLVGTPPQTQSVILDTGSSLLGFSCKTCSSCGKHLDNPFDIEASSTAQRYSCLSKTCVSRETCRARDAEVDVDTCLYSQVYSEGSSIQGYYFSDVISLESASESPTFSNPTIRYDYLGCHQKETVLFVTQKANGILGISFPKGGFQPTAMDTLFGSPQINSKVFALCVAEAGGVLTVGGYNESLHVPSSSLAPSQTGHFSWVSSLMGGNKQHPSSNSNNLRATNNGSSSDDNQVSSQQQTSSPVIVWTDIMSDSAYSVSVTSIQLNGEIITSGPFGEVLVDSGTTYSYFPPAVYSALANSLTALCNADSRCTRGQSDLVCWTFSSPDEVEESLSTIPSLFVTFRGGGMLEWRAKSYLFRKSSTQWCSAIENNRRVQTILGMSFLKSNNVIVDRENDQIGFVTANCPPNTRNPVQSVGSSAAGAASFQSLNNNNIDIPSFTPPTTSPAWGEGAVVTATGSGAVSAVTSDSNLPWVVAGGAGVLVVSGLAAVVVTSIRKKSRYAAIGSDIINVNDRNDDNLEGGNNPANRATRTNRIDDDDDVSDNEVEDSDDNFDLDDDDDDSLSLDHEQHASPLPDETEDMEGRHGGGPPPSSAERVQRKQRRGLAGITVMQVGKPVPASTTGRQKQ